MIGFVVHRPDPGIPEEEEPMFGTIARATLKPGQEGKLETFLQEWQRDIRPKIPGPLVTIMGHKAGQPDQIVFLALAAG